jgi:hypothetical protein
MLRSNLITWGNLGVFKPASSLRTTGLKISHRCNFINLNTFDVLEKIVSHKLDQEIESLKRVKYFQSPDRTYN